MNIPVPHDNGPASQHELRLFWCVLDEGNVDMCAETEFDIEEAVGTVKSYREYTMAQRLRRLPNHCIGTQCVRSVYSVPQSSHRLRLVVAPH